MAPRTVTAAEAALGVTVRGYLDTALKEGTTDGGDGGGVDPLPGPIALTAIPSILLDLYEIAFLTTLQGLAASAIPPTSGVPLPSFTVAGAGTLGAAGKTGRMIYISNEAGGAVPAFSDGTNWRRVTDRAIIS